MYSVFELKYLESWRVWRILVIGNCNGRVSREGVMWCCTAYIMHAAGCTAPISCSLSCRWASTCTTAAVVTQHHALSRASCAATGVITSQSWHFQLSVHSFQLQCGPRLKSFRNFTTTVITLQLSFALILTSDSYCSYIRQTSYVFRCSFLWQQFYQEKLLWIFLT